MNTIRTSEPANIFCVSIRTTRKILARLEIACSRCGWDEAPCDIHHIVPRSAGGSHDHSNLTYLCPNCHRLAHTKRIKYFVTLESQVGDRWRSVLYLTAEAKKDIFREACRPAFSKRRNRLHNEAVARAERNLQILMESGIDLRARGGPGAAARLLGMKNTYVSKWLKKYHPEIHGRIYKDHPLHRVGIAA